MSAATTKAKKAKGDTKPKQDANAIHHLGLKAHALAIQHQAKIGSRPAEGSQGKGTTGKERHAAEARMRDAVGWIGGAGVLAFATQAAVRAEFETLKRVKSG